MRDTSSKNPFSILLFVAVALIFTSIFVTGFTEEVDEYGEKRNIIGDDTVTYLDIEENETIELTEFLTIDLIDNGSDDNETDIRLNDDLSNESVEFSLSEGDEKKVVFDDYEVKLDEVNNVGEDEVSITVRHPDDADGLFINEYLVELFLGMIFTIVALGLIAILGGDMR